MEVETIKSNVGMSWDRVKLKTIAKISAGQSAPKDNDFNIQTGFPFIRAGHLEKLIANANIIELPKISKDNALKNRLKLISKGSILFAKSGMSAMMNRVYLVDQDSYYVSHLASVTPNNEILDSRFCYYFLMHFKTSKLIKDSAYPSIGLPDIENLDIPLPPLATQKRIAEILDAADALRRKDQELFKKYDELAQVIFIDMFGDPVKNEKGWEVMKIRDLICNTFTINRDYTYSNIEYIDISAIDNISKKILNTKNYDLNSAPSRAKQIVKHNDILVSTVRPNLNCVALVDLLIENLICSTGFCILRSDNTKINHNFLFEIVKFKSFIDELVKVAKGASYPAVSDFDILNIPIILPPIKLQLEYDLLIKNLKKQFEKNSMNLSENLLNTLIQKAFNGELVA